MDPLSLWTALLGLFCKTGTIASITWNHESEPVYCLCEPMFTVISMMFHNTFLYLQVYIGLIGHLKELTDSHGAQMGQHKVFKNFIIFQHSHVFKYVLQQNQYVREILHFTTA